MNLWKKGLALFLVLVFCVGMLPLQAAAAEDDVIVVEAIFPAAEGSCYEKGRVDGFLLSDGRVFRGVCPVGEGEEIDDLSGFDPVGSVSALETDYVHAGIGPEPVVEEPSCSAEGAQYYVCADCGTHFTDPSGAQPGETVLPRTAHSGFIAVEETPASCGEAGTAAHQVCGVCGALLDENGEEVGEDALVIPKLPHTPGELIAASPSSCGEAGMSAHRVCTVCGALLDENGEEVGEDALRIPKLPHTPGELIAGTPSSCSEAGTAAHAVCTVCGALLDENGEELGEDGLVLPKLPHTPGEPVEEKEASCSEAGMLAHSVCTVCGALLDENGEEADEEALAIPALPHTWGEWTPVEGEPGTEERFCEVCHEREIRSQAKNLSGSVTLDAGNFPDENFLAFVQNYDGLDGEPDGVLSEDELAAVTVMNVCGLDITDLTGIGYFGNLEELDCSNNALTALDLSDLSCLARLFATGNDLDILDVRGTLLSDLVANTNHYRSGGVVHFDFADSVLAYDETAILIAADPGSGLSLTDASAFPDRCLRAALAYGYDEDHDGFLSNVEVDPTTSLVLDGWGIQNLAGLNYFGDLDTLDVSNNPITVFSCPEGLLKLDLSGCSSLSSLEIGYSDLETLKLNGCSSLSSLELFCPNLETLELNGCSSLSSLYVGGCSDLTALDLSGLSSLEELTVVACGLICDPNVPEYTGLTLSGCSSLRSLYVGGAFELSALDLSGLSSLEAAAVTGCALTSLTLNGCSALSSLTVRGNQLSTLNLSKCTGLTKLSCENNALTSLDLSKCTRLSVLNCENNALSSLNLSKSRALTELYCGHNQLGSLNLSACPALAYFRCNNNPLTSLTLGASSGLIELNADQCPLSSLNLSKCSSLGYLRLRGCGLTALNVASCPGLIVLDCGHNQLSALNLGACPALEELYCDGNQIDSLDLSQNAALRVLWAFGNPLSILNICASAQLCDVHEDESADNDEYGYYSHSNVQEGVYRDLSVGSDVMIVADPGQNQPYDQGVYRGVHFLLYQDGTLECEPAGETGIFPYSSGNGGFAWNTCSNFVTRVVIADGITTIGSYAFANFSNLTEVQFPDTLTLIGDYAFQGCTALNSVYLPGGVDYELDLAFAGCNLCVWENGVYVGMPGAWSPLTILVAGNGSVSWTDLYDYDQDEYVGSSLAANPASGYGFVGWYEDTKDEDLDSTDPVSTVLNYDYYFQDEAAHTITARFEPLPSYLSLSQSSLVLEPGAEEHLALFGLADYWQEDRYQIFWSVEPDNGSVSVDQSGNVSAIADGSAYVKATLIFDGSLSFVARCLVTVRTELPPVELSGVVLSDSKPTVNLYSTHYANLVVAVQTQGELAGRSVEDLYPVTAVCFPDGDPAGQVFDLFTIPGGTGSVIIVPKNINAAVKGSYKTRLCVTIGDGSIAVPDLPLTITVNKSLPTLKAGAVKLNSYLRNDTQALSFTGGTVRSVRLDPNSQSPAWLRLFGSQGGSVRYINGVLAYGKGSAKLNLLATVEGWMKEIPVTVSVSAARTVPVFKAEKATLTLNPAIDPDLNPGDFTALLGDVGSAPIRIVKLEEGKTVHWSGCSDFIDLNLGEDKELVFFCGSEDPVLYAAMPNNNGFTAARSFKVTLRLYSGVSPLDPDPELNAADHVDTVVTVKTLAKNSKSAPVTTLKLSGTMELAIGSYITATPIAKNYNPGLLRYGYEFFNSNGEEVPSAHVESYDPDGEEYPPFFLIDDVSVPGSVRIYPGPEIDPAETYYVSAYAYLEDDPALDLSIYRSAPVKMTVKYTPGLKITAALKAAGSIDVVRPDASYITLTPNIKNWPHYYPNPEDLTFYCNGAEIADNDVPFHVFVSDGRFVLEAKSPSEMQPGAACLYHKNKYSVSLSFTTYYCTVQTKPVPLTVKMGGSKFRLEPSSLVMRRNSAANSMTFQIVATDETLSEISAVTLVADTSGSKFVVDYLGDGWCVLRFKDGQIPALNTATLKLQVLLAGNMSTTPNATLSLKLKLL